MISQSANRTNSLVVLHALLLTKAVRLNIHVAFASIVSGQKWQRRKKKGDCVSLVYTAAESTFFSLLHYLESWCEHWAIHHSLMPIYNFHIPFKKMRPKQQMLGSFITLTSPKCSYFWHSTQTNTLYLYFDFFVKINMRPPAWDQYGE